jgi:hypothetical protein
MPPPGVLPQQGCQLLYGASYKLLAYLQSCQSNEVLCNVTRDISKLAEYLQTGTQSSSILHCPKSVMRENMMSLLTNQSMIHDQWAIKAPIFTRHSAHRWRWGCQPYVLVTLYPQEDSWYSFLLEAESTQGHSAAGRIRWIKKSNDLTGIEPMIFQLVA